MATVDGEERRDGRGRACTCLRFRTAAATAANFRPIIAIAKLRGNGRSGRSFHDIAIEQRRPSFVSSFLAGSDENKPAPSYIPQIAFRSFICVRESTEYPAIRSETRALVKPVVQQPEERENGCRVNSFHRGVEIVSFVLRALFNEARQQPAVS